MEADRMCRILKIDEPPENIEILKTSWLSSCFKTKDMVPTKGFTLDVSVFEKKDVLEVSDTKPSKDADAEGSTSSADSEMKRAKVGVMFRANKKPKVESEGCKDDPDSDYSASDKEENNRLPGSESDGHTSASTTPQTSPNKIIQVKNVVRRIIV
ncbi:DNA polymerase lambda-like [Mizuhopecten yessoensis]|uniref:DNA polymerase lambda-like n=1 Tax=Mizuhopecten yessoensis TaxID=6573 RepID=UPI000B45CDF2|nr:DNA polymerase lambda-like [Mizuhopecten yessoensis]